MATGAPPDNWLMWLIGAGGLSPILVAWLGGWYQKKQGGAPAPAPAAAPQDAGSVAVLAVLAHERLAAAIERLIAAIERLEAAIKSDPHQKH